VNGIHEVRGSIPLGSTMDFKDLARHTAGLGRSAAIVHTHVSLSHALSAELRRPPVIHTVARLRTVPLDPSAVCGVSDTRKFAMSEWARRLLRILPSRNRSAVPLHSMQPGTK